MPIVIIHYHLDPGGVTEVIKRTSEAMMDAGTPHLILVGGTIAAKKSADHIRHINHLAYLDPPEIPTASDLLAQLREVTTNAFGPVPITWCFHNHSLGKNPLIPEVVRLLALSHERIVLHIHDLVENGRPENRSRILNIDSCYPHSPRIHYVFINSRDRQIFLDAGLASDHAHFIPNPAPHRRSPERPSNPPSHPLVFYPIRGIRRKNLGEIALLSILAPSGTRFAVSRAPSGKASRNHHDFWQLQAEAHSLPVDFEVTDHRIPPGGKDASFESWCDQSTHWITTSIAEGFGLAYFEAAASGKPLLGRRLPNIADQLPASSNQQLFDQLLIPASWIDQKQLGKRLSECINRLSAAWGRHFDTEFINSTMDHLIKSGYLDFGNLPEDFQLQAILHSLEQERQGEILINQGSHRSPANEWLAQHLSLESTSTSIHPCLMITPKEWLRRVSEIFSILEQAPATVPEWLDPQKILDPFLTPGQFHFLQCP